MKSIFYKVMILSLLIMLLGMGSACADRRGDTYTDTPPTEVLAHIQSRFSAYLLEDYIAISGTSRGDYGFALLSQGTDRLLIGYHKNGDEMEYWLKNANAVPQGDGWVYFQRHSAGSVISWGNTNATYSDALGFDVIRIAPDHEEYWSQSVSYHWRNGSFQLYEYMDRSKGHETAYVTDDGVSYHDITADESLGRVKGTVQRNLRYVSFSTLPKTKAQAKEKLTVAPSIPRGELSAESIKFTGGKKYEVYAAPSSSSLRGANGKAIVSTNDWIQVFGSENGYILIQYAIDKDQMRFGYIDEKALPKNASVQELIWPNAVSASITQRTILTDDPLNSQNALLTLPQGSEVTFLAVMGDWAYVETTDGEWARGFVPQNVVSCEPNE